MIRAYFSFPKGRLDLRIAHHDVDVKNTIGNTWMIPQEAVGFPCLLLAENDTRSICSAGLLIARPANLIAGKNQDKKRSVSKAGRDKIHWLFKDAPMDYLWNEVERDQIHRIMDSRVRGKVRLTRLFAHIQNRPISRDTIKSVARQKDYMKRLRRNGGARDDLETQGIVVLSGKYHRTWITEFSLPSCTNDEFISFRPNKTQWRKLEKARIVS